MKSSKENSLCIKETDNYNNKMLTFKKEVCHLKDKTHIFKKGIRHMIDIVNAYKLVLQKYSSIRKYINMFRIGKKTKKIKK